MNILKFKFKKVDVTVTIHLDHGLYRDRNLKTIAISLACSFVMYVV